MAVYLIQHEPDGLIKIGWTRWPIEKRLAVFQAHSPVPLVVRAIISSDRGLEAELHARFVGSLSHGEWFKPTDDLLRFIAEHNSGKQPEMIFSKVAALRHWLSANRHRLSAIAKETGVPATTLRELIAGDRIIPRPTTLNPLLAAMGA